MNPLRKAWCRTYQTAFRIVLPVLPYREPRSPRLGRGGARGAARAWHLLGASRDGPRHRPDWPYARARGCACPRGDFVRHVRQDRRQPHRCQRRGGSRPLPRERLPGHHRLWRGLFHGLRQGQWGHASRSHAKSVGQHARTPSRAPQVCRCSSPCPPRRERASEVTLAAVITDEKTHHKYPINDFALIPSATPSTTGASRANLPRAHHRPDGHGRAHSRGRGVHWPQHDAPHASRWRSHAVRTYP